MDTPIAKIFLATAFKRGYLEPMVSNGHGLFYIVETKTMFTHEQFVHAVAQHAIARLASDEQAKLKAIKLVYGVGENGLRGVTYFQGWKGGKGEAMPFVEVCAKGQESVCQLAGTTIHELGHALAGWSAGHGPGWKEACAKLGLRNIKAAGTRYGYANFVPDMRDLIARLPQPTDGKPGFWAGSGGGGKGGTGTAMRIAPKPCTAGIGTKGGKSRGKGSGSRLRLFECECVPVIKVRLARDEFDATCNCCRSIFHRV